MWSNVSLVSLLISCLYVSGCLHTAVPSPKVRADNAAYLAQKTGWNAYTISTSSFTFKAYGSPLKRSAKILTIYIEGDGLAWLSEDMPSDNPSPINPIGLKMALHDQKNLPLAYLARSCQFVFHQAWKGCREAYWTNLRFSPKVIHATNQALDYLKKLYHTQHIRLIGYSGGGTIAALIASQRTDIIELITVAAVLDTHQWVRQKNLTPLYGSLNPADAWKNIAAIPQTHWVGGKDTVVPKEVAFSFAEHFPSTQKPRIVVIPTFNHRCCWATQWTP